MSMEYPLSFFVPPIPKKHQEDKKRSKPSTAPVVVGHLTHAHEAALNYRPNDTYDRFYQRHESERLAGYLTPVGPKAATVLPALVGEWACAPLEAPRPRDLIRGGSAPQPARGEPTRDWEERGAIFWHVESVGTMEKAAGLMHRMENLGAGPVCNEASEESRKEIRFLGRYTINDYGVELATNQSLPTDDPNKATIGYLEDSTTHFDILLGEQDREVSLGSVCYFSTVEEYWEHFTTDLSCRRDAMNNNDMEEDLDEVSFSDGLQLLPNQQGALVVARKPDWMFLRAFLLDAEDSSGVPQGVKAFVFYHSIGPDDWSFSDWRVGHNAPIIPGKGLPPGGALDRNDQVDNLYGCRPFVDYNDDNSKVKEFFDSMTENDLNEWWSFSLTKLVRTKFARRMILAGFWSLWQRLQRATDSSDTSLISLVDSSSWVQLASKVPELDPSVARAIMFQDAPTVSMETRRAMRERIAAIVATTPIEETQ